MKTFFKVSMILVVVIALAAGSGLLYAGNNDVKKVETKKGCCHKVAAKDASCKKEMKCEHKTVYVCPTEGCKYKAQEPGKCPTCKKDLVKKTLCCVKLYVCPVKGCKFKAHAPGKCEKCGKELVEKVICKPYKDIYICPVEKCAYTSCKPGKCPKCGKELVKSSTCCTAKPHAHKKHKAHQQSTKALYVCPMKGCGVKSDKPGKCPKCGMELKKVEKGTCPKSGKACSMASKCKPAAKEETNK